MLRFDRKWLSRFDLAADRGLPV